MKRLLPFDRLGPGYQPVNSHKQTGALRRLRDEDITAVVTPSIPADPRPPHTQVAPDPRRTALYAVVSRSEPGVLHVREAPIEVAPFRDTALAHVAYKGSDLTGEDTLISFTENTSFDMASPEQVTAPGTPVIVIGLAVGNTIEAEIIAGMDAEPRYRAAVSRYQQTRDWQRPMSIQP